ncbi:MAG TPA: hypothetical protein ENG69_04150 [Candidatus Korarchaeota archaeon]|nr:hypothetical protein [Candidatus Korarchaeota archaeon]
MTSSREGGEILSLNEGEGFVSYGPIEVVVVEGEVEIWGAPADHFKVLESDVPVLVRALSPSRLGVKAPQPLKILKGIVPEEWEQAASEASAGDVLAVLGGVDVGKSGFTTFVANRLALRGLRVGIVDADVGQSDVGPPGTIGLAVFEEPILHPKLVEPAGLFFVGDISPHGHLLPMVVGTLRLTQLAKSLGADVILVNTTGLIHGGVARALKRFKLLAVRPTHVILIERDGEASHLVGLVPPDAKLRRIRSPEYASEKYRSLRRFSRRAAYARYLEGAAVVSYDLKEVRLLSTSLGSGERKPDLIEPMGRALGCNLLHVEESPDQIVLVCEGRPDPKVLKTVQELTGKEVRYTTGDSLRGLYVGLLDDRGFCSAVGILEEIDFNSWFARVKTKYYGVPHAIEFGHVRLSDELEEVGRRGVWEA